MGNQFGFFTIYVEPIDSRRENFIVKLVRKFENKVLPLILPKNGLPTNHALVKEP